MVVDSSASWFLLWALPPPSSMRSVLRTSPRSAVSLRFSATSSVRVERDRFFSDDFVVGRGGATALSDFFAGKFADFAGAFTPKFSFCCCDITHTRRTARAPWHKPWSERERESRGESPLEREMKKSFGAGRVRRKKRTVVLFLFFPSLVWRGEKEGPVPLLPPWDDDPNPHGSPCPLRLHWR